MAAWDCCGLRGVCQRSLDPLDFNNLTRNNVRKHHCQEGRRVANEILRLL